MALFNYNTQNNWHSSSKGNINLCSLHFLGPCMDDWLSACLIASMYLDAFLEAFKVSMWPPFSFSALDLGCCCWSCDVHLDSMWCCQTGVVHLEWSYAVVYKSGWMCFYWLEMDWMNLSWLEVLHLDWIGAYWSEMVQIEWLSLSWPEMVHLTWSWACWTGMVHLEWMSCACWIGMVYLKWMGFAC